MTTRMAPSTGTRKTEGAKPQDKDFVARLADAGEEALHKIAELPGGGRVLNTFNDLKSRVDDLAKKVRGMDELESRITKLEREVATLKKAKPASRGSSAAKSS
jgi:polyhydroxyalkanoate synthesis regulator phasin